MTRLVKISNYEWRSPKDDYAVIYSRTRNIWEVVKREPRYGFMFLSRVPGTTTYAEATDAREALRDFLRNADD